MQTVYLISLDIYVRHDTSSDIYISLLDKPNSFSICTYIKENGIFFETPCRKVGGIYMGQYCWQYNIVEP